MTAVDTPAGPVTVAWDEPRDPRATLVFAHGAGGNLHSPGVRDVAAALAERGVAVARFNFAYSEARRKAPDKMPKLLEVFAAVAEHARSRHGARPLLAGGRSMGGRAASHLAADGFACDGVVLLAYPLHPPGRPERIRDAHLPDIAVPVLWIQGTRDAFATPALLAGTVAALGTVTFEPVDGADHSFKRPGAKAAEIAGDLAGRIAAWIDATFVH